MGYSDLLFLPVYIAIFYSIFASRRKRYTDPILQHYHKIGFWAKILAVVAFTVFNGKISMGDSYLLYYTEGINIKRMILEHPANINMLFMKGPEFDQTLLANPLNEGYFKSENNYLVTKISCFFSFFSMGTYVTTNMFFGMIAYTGAWRLFRFFYDQYPDLHKKFAIAILYFPTVIFWSAGVLKDSICVAALGWLTYALYESLFKKRNVPVNTIIAIGAGYTLLILKAYILVSYLPFFILYLFLKNVSLIKNKFLQLAVVVGLAFLSINIFSQVMSTITTSVGEYATEDVAGSVSKYQAAYAGVESRSSYSLGVEFDGSISSLLKLAPMAITVTLFRPFLWEASSAAALLSSVESLLVMYLTITVLIMYGFRGFFSAISKEPTVLYCLLFSVLFALFVGATTGNFGSLVRYKIPCMPFYVVGMFIIEYQGKKIRGKTNKSVAAKLESDKLLSS
jgi:hypothetical protein